MYIHKKTPRNTPAVQPRTQSLNLTLCKRNAFNTTDTELNAIAAPATHGARSPAAAIGIPTELYANAQNKFCFIFRTVNRLILIVSATRNKSPCINVTSAASIATAVPVPIAIPISATASAGASFMPSQPWRPAYLQPVTKRQLLPCAQAAQVIPEIAITFLLSLI